MNREELSDPFLAKRQWMVETQLRKRGLSDKRVLDAMMAVPRHYFVPEGKMSEAYEDQPLEIAERQTISQPYITAVMLQALSLAGHERVLEVGTGSGYATALLTVLAAQVYTIERHESLFEFARQRLNERGYLNKVNCVLGDGSQGFKEFAPYDAIVVSAAAPAVPPALIEQLASGGRLVVPVGNLDSQELLLLRRIEDHISTERIESCRFVPLIGISGFPQ